MPPKIRLYNHREKSNASVDAEATNHFGVLKRSPDRKVQDIYFTIAVCEVDLRTSRSHLPALQSAEKLKWIE